MKTIKQMSAAARWDNPLPPAQEQASSSLQPAGSANAPAAKDALKKEIARIIDAAFTAGFDSDNAGALDRFDGFALADAAIEQYWPNDQAEPPAN